MKQELKEKSGEINKSNEQHRKQRKKQMNL